jgi:hypothetical protein
VILFIVFLLCGAIVLPIISGFKLSNNFHYKIENYSISVDKWNQVVYSNYEGQFNNKNNYLRLNTQIKIGDIVITGDGTLEGSQVRVKAEDKNLQGYNGKIVDFYIDYSIINGWTDDSSRVEIITKLNG